MAAQTTLNKQIHSLISQYIKCWTEKHKEVPTINRYREKWGFQSMIEDLGYDRAKQVIDYYFTTSKAGHPLKYLLFNYDRLSGILKELEADEKHREELRAKTEARVKEWEELSGN